MNGPVCWFLNDFSQCLRKCFSLFSNLCIFFIVMIFNVGYFLFLVTLESFHGFPEELWVFSKLMISTISFHVCDCFV